jgi:hypothetical protein
MRLHFLRQLNVLLQTGHTLEGRWGFKWAIVLIVLIVLIVFQK